jgi:hypothetical protein
MAPSVSECVILRPVLLRHSAQQPTTAVLKIGRMPPQQRSPLPQQHVCHLVSRFVSTSHLRISTSRLLSYLANGQFRVENNRRTIRARLSLLVTRMLLRRLVDQHVISMLLCMLLHMLLMCVALGRHLISRPADLCDQLRDREDGGFGHYWLHC